MDYWGKLTALSDASTTNWMLTNAPDVYLYGSLYYLGQLTRDKMVLAFYDAAYRDAAKALQLDSDRRRWSGSSMQMRTGPT